MLVMAEPIEGLPPNRPLGGECHPQGTEVKLDESDSLASMGLGWPAALDGEGASFAL
jgi:hypothetical protein